MRNDVRYHVFACDYDETIASNGKISTKTLQALREVRDSGRKLVLVTGRILDDLLSVFPGLELFDRVVAENGALLYCPATREQRLLADPPPKEFADELVKRGPARVSLGRVIVATRSPHETTAVEVIRELGLELQVIFNKGAVMILPSGVNKATGLNAALQELGLSRHNVVGVGDAENDHAFLSQCECSVAVENALEALKEKTDWVTAGADGEGTVELIRSLVATDLDFLAERLPHRLVLGRKSDATDVWIEPYGKKILLAGTQDSLEYTLLRHFLDRLLEQGYQFTVLDQNGDLPHTSAGTVLGDGERSPSIPQAMDLLSKPDQNAILNLCGIPLTERPSFYSELWPRLREFRAQTGRPHWIVISEPHDAASAALQGLQGMGEVMIVAPSLDRIPAQILAEMDLVVAFGAMPNTTFEAFCKAIGQTSSAFSPMTVQAGQAAGWFRSSSCSPFIFEVR
ncbi:MAG: phosphoglycolate phosphatase [Acidobacteria bacterium]|nr:MAG: phosphoglycolate phosphatase [Acidobacteriota bacterium]